ncbi:MAG: HAD family hydrolase [Deltaproteobacteria bacterium]|nr:HAD family hydrolase [Deltaproteobacteria bacterium]
MLRGIIFDLDGTLADTLEDIADAMNHALSHAGFPTHPVSAYRDFVGEGVEILAERVLPTGQRNARGALVASFRSQYGAHLVDKSRPFPGILTLLGTLAERGVPTAVLSNKPEPATLEVVRRLFGGCSLAPVVGQRPKVPRKPDPASALGISRTLAVPPSSCALVGDTPIDMATARAAGMLPVGVAWGFRSPEELMDCGAHVVLRNPMELLGLL